MVAGFDVIDFLRMLTDRSVQLLDVSATGCHWLTRAVTCGWWPPRTGSTGERTEADQEKRWGHLPGCPAAPCSPGAGDHRPDRRFPGVSERGQGHKAREDSAASVGRGIVEAHTLRSPGFLRGWASCYRYWPVAALSVLDTRTDTTLARLMMTPFSSASRSYLAWRRTRLRCSSSARATASSASWSPVKSSDITETSSPPTG